ncbi:MAG: HDIG domain-containing protein [Gaiellales bacterium]|nr:MAG: HDIG domain-containing protein [Gaiellales bacterium]
MNLSQQFRHATRSYRRRLENMPMRSYSVSLSLVTAVTVWAVLASVFLPAKYDLEVGDVAEDSIKASRTLTFENSAETERRKQQAAAQVPDVTVFDAKVLSDTRNSLSAFFTDASKIISEERQKAAAAGQPYDPVVAAARIEALPDADGVEEEALRQLAAIDPARLGQISAVSQEAIQSILGGNVTAESLPRDRDRLRAVMQTMALSEQEYLAASEVAASMLVPNNVVDEEKTSQARDQAASEVQAVIVTVRAGETILSPGEVVSQDDLATLSALGLTDQDRQVGAIAGLALLALAEILFIFFYVYRYERKVRSLKSLQFICASLLVLFTLADRLSIISPLSPLAVPMVALGVVATITLGTRMASLIVIIVSINLAAVGGSAPHYIIVSLLGGMAAVYLSTSVILRRDLMRAGLYAGLFSVIVSLAAGQITESSWSQAGLSIIWGLGNTLSSIIVAIGILSVYEMVFNLPTPLKLLELADPTRPLLKQLMMNAPGTYNHSILMGNIAETAAEAIGANPLLARVGAYYHDIGKLNRPDYFIENQFHVRNPHDRLTPGLSRLAITAHVKDGVALAREEGLPPEILDIIREHHGTTVLSYFYNKALQSTREGKVDQETYRYAGQKPTSRESAIIMLADSVEAAVRSLGDPTMRSIKKVISDILDQRLRDGQLSETNMTFADLEKVKRAFEACLKGFGASRIPYPQQEQRAAGGRE